jgi:ssDNA-binding Zn-finger/Zn-ribbon topoisomerase 1
MTQYYKEMMQKGFEFQDFIADKLIEKLGISVTCYSSKQHQEQKGENRQGFEIKFDDKYKTTGNIYIETAEKSNEKNPFFVSSGIYRSDNTWLYLIGNYEEVFIFSKKHLVLMHKTQKYRNVETKTSKGFLIPFGVCEQYCLNKLIF